MLESSQLIVQQFLHFLLRPFQIERLKFFRKSSLSRVCQTFELLPVEPNKASANFSTLILLASFCKGQHFLLHFR